MRFVVGVTSAALIACGRIEFDPLSDGAGGVSASCGVAPTCPVSALLCDSFEGATIDNALWSMNPTNATLDVDSARACRGAQSLHPHTSAITTGSTSANLHTRSFPFARTTLYARFYMFLSPTSAPDSSVERYSFMQALNLSNQNGVSLRSSSANIELINTQGTSDIRNSMVPYPLGRWICLEWQIDFPSADSVADGAVHVRLDGDPVMMVAPWSGLSFSPSADPIVELELGMGVYSVGSLVPAADVWIDDVAVGNAPIACTD